MNEETITYECEQCGKLWEVFLDCEWPRCPNPECKEDVHIHIF